MPEVEECRYCARCCVDCIFLEYDRGERKFKCLIYKNKYRLPIYYDYSHIYRFKNFEEYLLTDLERMLKYERRKGRKCCDDFTCYTLQRENKIDRDIRISKLTKRDILSLRRVRYARKRRIPNFRDLVEILNS